MTSMHTIWSSILHEGHELKEDFENLREKLDLSLEHLLANPAKVRHLFGTIRNIKPILVLPKVAIVTKYPDVLEVLRTDTVFGVSEIYLKKMQQTTGDFVLGLPNGPQYQNEIGLMRQAVSSEDLTRIKMEVSAIAKSLVAAVAPHESIDVVGGLSRVAAMRLCGSYFGAPGDHEPTMMRWMRAIFRQIFLNLGNDPKMAKDAHEASAGLKAYLDGLIAKRKSEIADGISVPDDFLCRLIKLQIKASAPFADEVIRRILGGTIVGVVDTNSKAITQALDVLLNRPAELRLAAQAAAANDDNLLSRYIFEALRFNPQNPFLIRHCDQDYTLAAGTPRETNIHKGSLVIAGTEMAMFDPEIFPEPDAFRVDRPSDKYIHFGSGLHTCFGKMIGQIVIPVIAKELLLCNNLRRAPGVLGQLAYDGAFPDRLIVEFDR